MKVVKTGVNTGKTQIIGENKFSLYLEGKNKEMKVMRR